MTHLDAHGLLSPAGRPRRIDAPPSMEALVRRLVDRWPDRTVLVGRTGRLTAVELDDASRRAARALHDLGVGAGDRVAASLPNDVDIVVAFLGAMRLGAIWLGLNRQLAAPEKVYMLDDAQAATFLASPETVDQVRAHSSELGALREIVSVAPGTDDDRWRSLLTEASDEPPTVEIDPLSPAAIAYTSGTTGFPKGAVHSQHNMLLPGAVAAWRTASSASSDHTPMLGVPLPLTILNLMILGPCAAYQSGTPVVAMDRIDALGMAEWIAAEQISTFAAVPAMVHDLLTHPEVDDEMLASIDTIGVGGADMPDAFRRLYEERFGRRVGTGYGLTEAPTSVTAEDVSEPPVPGSCGRALPQVEILIRDETGEDLAPGEVGEVCVAPSSAGPFADTYRPMLGYWNRPDETMRALDGGVLRTGDIGCLDAAGNLFIKDRKNDLIIRGGANVYPAEVERALHDLRAIEACAVVGVPDDRLGERVVAFVQLRQDSDVSAEAIQDHCRSLLARYKVPDTIRFVSGFDRTPMGKIRKTALRASLAPDG